MYIIYYLIKMLPRIEFFAVNGTVYKNLSAYIKQTYKFFIFCAICKYYTNDNISAYGS